MADQKEVLQKYVSDMISLEDHIHQAIDKQIKENESRPEIKSRLTTFSNTTASHRNILEARLKALGGAANSPIKQGVAAVAGVAAGAIDKLRSEEISKDFRDDYTALSLNLISYQMLHTTAQAFGDTETAQLAAQNVKDTANFMAYIQQILPSIVVSELQKNHDVSVNAGAPEETKKLVESIWK